MSAGIGSVQSVARASIARFAHDAERRRPLQLANDAHREWREHCARVTRAYGSWANADSSESEQAWEAYEDALALEEIAAARYTARVESQAFWTSTHDAPLTAQGRPLPEAASKLRIVNAMQRLTKSEQGR